MSPMRTTRTKRGAERAEEPQEPVKATESAKADHAATDALLDTIEDLLDPATAEEVKPKPWQEALEEFLCADSINYQGVETTVRSLWEKFAVASFDPARDRIQFLSTPRTEDEQAILYEQFRRERETRPEPDDIPWEDIAKLPMPGPGGRYVEWLEPEEIEWAAADDPTRIAPIRHRTRTLLVTRAMWEEAQRGLVGRPRRQDGGDGMCPKCGWPKAGPGRFPCNQSAWAMGIYMPPPDPTKLVNITGV